MKSHKWVNDTSHEKAKMLTSPHLKGQRNTFSKTKISEVHIMFFKALFKTPSCHPTIEHPHFPTCPPTVSWKTLSPPKFQFQCSPISRKTFVSCIIFSLLIHVYYTNTVTGNIFEENRSPVLPSPYHKLFKTPSVIHISMTVCLHCWTVSHWRTSPRALQRHSSPLQAVFAVLRGSLHANLEPLLPTPTPLFPLHSE